MANSFQKLTAPARWQLLNLAARRSAAEAGFEMVRRPGRGMSNIWELRKGTTVQVASIRTSRDRYIAFPPLDGGAKWKTLDDVDVVLVAVVDSKDDPTAIEVYLLPANEVRDRFAKAYAARTGAGHIVQDNFGMWVNLDADGRGLPVSVGAGILQHHKALGRYAVDDLLSGSAVSQEDSDATTDDEAPPAFTSIGGVMGWARQQISALAGVNSDAVKLDLKIEY